MAALTVRFLSGEDNWVCENGEWKEHGKPKASKPTTSCLKTSVIPTQTEIKNAYFFRNLNIKTNQTIFSPLIITGEARGTWFFEASFPVILTDKNGGVIAQNLATAKGEWMTENFVPFEANIEFIKPKNSKNGTLILKKDNPSGLPENDGTYEIPIIFE